MGFKAGEKVDALGPYDFRPYLNEQGPIAEPSPDAIQAYLESLDASFRETARSTEEFAERLNATKTVDERRTIDAEFEKWQSVSATDTVALRRRLLSELLGDSPSLSSLEKLPGRIFDAFEQYIQEALTPKARTSDTNG